MFLAGIFQERRLGGEPRARSSGPLNRDIFLDCREMNSVIRTQGNGHSARSCLARTHSLHQRDNKLYLAPSTGPVLSA
jgi:hypothetical protein